MRVKVKVEDAISAVPGIQWGVAQRPKAGESLSGDAALVLELPEGCLLAVADGLGHGAEAARASQLAMTVLRNQPQSSLGEMLQACNEALRESRGAVMNLAWVNYSERTLTWLGIGNVSGILLRAGAMENAKEYLLNRGGVVGSQMQPPYTVVRPIAPGDSILFFTDGVQAACGVAFNDLITQPERLANSLLQKWARDDDDALVLVARYLGDGQP